MRVDTVYPVPEPGLDLAENLLRSLTPEERANVVGDPVPKHELDTWLKYKNVDGNHEVPGM